MASVRRACADDVEMRLMRACLKGDVDELVRLVVQSKLMPSQLAIDQAAGAGHIKILDWIWSETDGTARPQASGLEMATAAGKIATLEWSHTKGLECFGPGLMDIAAWRGRLSVLKWLHANRDEGCTSNAVPWAAKRGHLKVLRWLRDSLGEPYSLEGLEAAAEAGNLDTVDWFLRNGKTLSTRHAIVLAAANGHPDVLRRLLSQGRERRQSEWAAILARRGGHAHCLKILQDSQTMPEARTFDGHLSVLQDDTKEAPWHEGEGEENEAEWYTTFDDPHREQVVSLGHMPASGRTATIRLLRRPTVLHSLGSTTPDSDQCCCSAAFAANTMVPASPPHPPEPKHVTTTSQHKTARRGIVDDLPRTSATVNTPTGCAIPTGKGGDASSPSPSPCTPRSFANPHRRRRCLAINVAIPNDRKGVVSRGSGRRYFDCTQSTICCDRLAVHGADPEKEGIKQHTATGGIELRLDEFLRATVGLSTGPKATVRDLSTPVPGAKLSRGLPERCLNLGVLQKSSQEPVVAAYIAGLNRVATEHRKERKHTESRPHQPDKKRRNRTQSATNAVIDGTNINNSRWSPQNSKKTQAVASVLSSSTPSGGCTGSDPVMIHGAQIVASSSLIQSKLLDGQSLSACRVHTAPRQLSERNIPTTSNAKSMTHSGRHSVTSDTIGADNLNNRKPPSNRPVFGHSTKTPRTLSSSSEMCAQRAGSASKRPSRLEEDSVSGISASRQLVLAALPSATGVVSADGAGLLTDAAHSVEASTITTGTDLPAINMALSDITIDTAGLPTHSSIEQKLAGRGEDSFAASAGKWTPYKLDDPKIDERCDGEHTRNLSMFAQKHLVSQQRQNQPWLALRVQSSLNKGRFDLVVIGNGKNRSISGKPYRRTCGFSNHGRAKSGGWGSGWRKEDMFLTRNHRRFSAATAPHA